MVVAAALGSTVSSLAPRIETVCGNPTEVVRVGGGPLRLVFVPGNPGRCHHTPHPCMPLVVARQQTARLAAIQPQPA